MKAFLFFKARALTLRGPKNSFPPEQKTKAPCTAEFFRARVQGLRMEPPDREACSFELARTLVYAASRDLANAQLSSEEKARAMRLVIGFLWAKKAIRDVVAAKISVVAQRAVRHPHAKDLARKWRAWLRRIWPSHPPSCRRKTPVSGGISSRQPASAAGHRRDSGESSSKCSRKF